MAGQEEIATHKTRIRQLTTQLELEVEAQKKAAKGYAQALADKEADVHREVKVMEDRFRADIDRIRQESVRLLAWPLLVGRKHFHLRH